MSLWTGIWDPRWDRCRDKNNTFLHLSILVRRQTFTDQISQNIGIVIIYWQNRAWLGDLEQNVLAWLLMLPHRGMRVWHLARCENDWKRWTRAIISVTLLFPPDYSSYLFKLHSPEGSLWAWSPRCRQQLHDSPTQVHSWGNNTNIIDCTFDCLQGYLDSGEWGGAKVTHWQLSSIDNFHQ